MFVSHTEEKDVGDELEDTLVEVPAAAEEPSSDSRGHTGTDPFGLPPSFFAQFQSPPKKEQAQCTDLVPWQGPMQGPSKPLAKRNLEEKSPRPVLKRQFARSNFELDQVDWQTLAEALAYKDGEENENDQGNKEAAEEAKKARKSPKKTKAKAKKQAKSKATKDKSPCPKASSVSTPKKSKKGNKQTVPKAAKAATPKKKKSTFRHRRTSTAYHSAKNAALKGGFSPMSASLKGREASHRIGEQIDQGLLKEE